LNKNITLGVLLTLILTGITIFTFQIQPVNATIEKIYIRSDGSIDPPEAPISTGDFRTYFLLENIINKSIVVERDNITFNGRGLTISGNEESSSIGINVTDRHNVTINNTNIEKFDMGIYAVYSSHITLTGNNVSNNKILLFMPPFDFYWIGTGISVSRSNETLIFNNTVSKNIFGISLYQSNNTRVAGNNVTANIEQEDTTYVGTGIYISESKNTTATDNVVSNNGAIGISLGSGTMGYPCCNNTISHNMITGHNFGPYSYGLYVSWSRNNTISENLILSNTYGIHVRYSSQAQTIINNNVSLNTWGIYLDSSTNNTIVENILFKNVDGITFENEANHNRILHNNILNSSSFGIYIRSDSRNNLVGNNNVSNNSRGIRFTESNNNAIIKNNISSNTNDGLVIYYYSSNNEVTQNNIASNNYGITITYECYNTKIFHNNFIGNTLHVFTDVNSTWDNNYPSGGNYWSNYTGTDFKWGSPQIETGSDGIGDIPHKIDDNNMDGYPLMAPINIFDAGIWDMTSRHVDIISNSTVSNFKINTTEKTISFNVTGETGSGFCRVIIPNTITQTLWSDDYFILINGLTVSFRNWTDTENTYIYFTYTYSEHEVIIIPEFPSATFLPLLIILSAAAAIYAKKKHPKRNTNLTPTIPALPS
jgi:parallel beta-helix repeat protein